MIGLGRVFGVLFCVSVIGFGCLGAVLQKDESKGVPEYAGFSAIDPTKNSFIIVGDTQRTSFFEFWRERNDRERHLIADEIARRRPAFVVHLGDLTNGGGSRREWDEFDNLNKSSREKEIPYFPILGNHELSGNNEKALGYYFGRFRHLEQRRWYSFTWKNVGLIMVDSNFSTLTREQNETQSAWYLEELKRFETDRRIDHIIVSCHEPPFTNSRVVHPNKEVKTSFADPFLRSRKARLFFGGHSHAYERFEIDGKFFVVSGGGGGPRHKVFTDSKKARYADSFEGPEKRFFHFCEIENRNMRPICRIIRLRPDGSFAVGDSFEFPEVRRRSHRDTSPG